MNVTPPRPVSSVPPPPPGAPARGRRPGAAALFAATRNQNVPAGVLNLPPFLAAAAQNEGHMPWIHQPNFEAAVTLPPADFDDSNPNELETIDIPAEYANIINSEPYMNGDILYRVSGMDGSTDPTHYAVIRRQGNPDTIARQFMIQRHISPATREPVDFEDRSRMRVVRLVGENMDMNVNMNNTTNMYMNRNDNMYETTRMAGGKSRRGRKSRKARKARKSRKATKGRKRGTRRH